MFVAVGERERVALLSESKEERSKVMSAMEDARCLEIFPMVVVVAAAMANTWRRRTPLCLLMRTRVRAHTRFLR